MSKKRKKNINIIYYNISDRNKRLIFIPPLFFKKECYDYKYNMN